MQVGGERQGRNFLELQPSPQGHYLLWEQPEESAVRIHIPAGTALPSLA